MIDAVLTEARFTDLPELREQFARLARGASVVFCLGPASWARFPHPTAVQVQEWIDSGLASVAKGRDVRDPEQWLHRVYRLASEPAGAPAVPLRSALAFEATEEGQVWALLRDCALAGNPCPSNEAIADALGFETANEASYKFKLLKRQGRIVEIEPARFGPRVIEVVQPGGPSLRTAASKGFGK